MIIINKQQQDYESCYEAMKVFTAQRTDDTPDELWLVEHPPVFTLGKAGKPEHVLPFSHNIPIIQTDRGGQVTYHGPGQIVAYPLINLHRLGIYVKELVYRLEQSVIQTLEQWDIVGQRVSGAPGIYVPFAQNPNLPQNAEFPGLAKIAALGIKVSRGCCYHGLALNVNMDLTPYSYINPCGYEDLKTVDMQSVGINVSLSDVADKLAERLKAHFSKTN